MIKALTRVAIGAAIAAVMMVPTYVHAVAFGATDITQDINTRDTVEQPTGYQSPGIAQCDDGALYVTNELQDDGTTVVICHYPVNQYDHTQGDIVHTIG